MGHRPQATEAPVLYRALDHVIYATVLAVAVGVPTVFSAWTVESGYVKDVLRGLLVLTGVCLWAVRTILYGRTEFARSPLNVAVLCYMAAALVATILSPFPLTSVRALWRMLVFAGLYLLAANFAASRRRIAGLLAAVCAGALPVCAYAFVQKLGYDPVHWSQTPEWRVFSSIGNPNMLGGYNAIVIPIAASFALSSRRSLVRALGALAAAASAVCLALTETKGAWLGMAGGAAVFAGCVLVSRMAVTVEWTRRRKLSLAAGACVAVLALGLLAWPVTRHFQRTLGGSARPRLVYWQGALKMFAAQPALGAGLGTFQIQFPRYRAVTFRSANVTYNTLHAHSEYLEALAEQGVLGGLALMFLIGMAATVGLRGLRSGADVSLKWTLCGLLAGLSCTLVHSLVCVVLRWSTCPTYVWLVLGLIAAVGRLAAGEETTVLHLSIRRWASPLLALAVVVLAAAAGHAFVILPFRAQIELRQGDRFARLGLYDGAARVLQDAIRHDPVEMRSYYQLAHAYHEKKDYQKALETYRTLQQYAPDFAQIHYNTGVVYAALGRWEEAGEEITVASRMGTIPPEVDVRPLLARLRGGGEGEDKYVAVLKELVKANPEDKLSWNRLGIYYFQKKDFAEAEGRFEKALEADPEYVPALNNLAGVYYNRGEFDRAIATCERILKINPRAAKPHVNIGRAYYLKGDRAKAAEHWQRALAIDPDEPEAKKCLAELGG